MLIVLGEIEAFIAAAQKMEVRCSLLEEECDKLRAGLGGTIVPAGLLGLSGLEAAIVGLLLEGAEVKRSTIYSVIYADRPRKPKATVLGAIMSSARRKLDQVGIEIQTLYGHGYQMPGGSKALLRQLITTHKKVRDIA